MCCFKPMVDIKRSISVNVAAIFTAFSIPGSNLSMILGRQKTGIEVSDNDNGYILFAQITIQDLRSNKTILFELFVSLALIHPNMKPF